MRFFKDVCQTRPARPPAPTARPPAGPPTHAIKGQSPLELKSKTFLVLELKRDFGFARIATTDLELLRSQAAMIER